VLFLGKKNEALHTGALLRKATSSFRRRPESMLRAGDGFRPSPTAVRGKCLHVLQKWLKRSSSSESWDPATYGASKALDPSFRWDDDSVVLNFPGKLPRIAHFFKSLIFPGQQWAFAGMTVR
jgi:hypothetical protein